MGAGGASHPTFVILRAAQRNRGTPNVGMGREPLNLWPDGIAVRGGDPDHRLIQVGAGAAVDEGLGQPALALGRIAGADFRPQLVEGGAQLTPEHLCRLGVGRLAVDCEDGALKAG